MLPHSRNEGAIIVYLAKGIPEQNALRHLFFSFSFFRGKAAEEPPGASAVAASIYQRFSFLHAGLDLGQLLLLLLCGDSTESAKQSTKAGAPQRNQEGGIRLNRGSLLTSIEGGGGGALAGEGGRGLAVLPLVALEYLAHGCCSRLASISFLHPRPNPSGDTIQQERLGGVGSSGRRGRT